MPLQGMSKEWVEQIKKNFERTQIILDGQLCDSFFKEDLTGMEQALSKGANPNYLMYYSPEAGVASNDGFSVTFMDIIEYSGSFTEEQKGKLRDIFINAGGSTTDEGLRAFHHWAQKGLPFRTLKRCCSHRVCLNKICLNSHTKV